ncbi:MAG: class I SAM-dependent methyltransferase [Spirochaetes bacterium]|nr:class I SAM-dependent methyltransferase [Spirochaetota bacterium]
MNPPLSKESISKLYQEGYYTGKADYTYYDERKAEQYAKFVWDARLKTIRKYVAAGNFLDVGCSFGGFLNAASKYYTVYGIEPSHYSAKYAQRRFGKDYIHCGTLSDHPFAHNTFSVITMIEVLEHIQNPLEALIECYQLCITGGLLVIQTANMDGLQAVLQKEQYGYFLPGHFSYFTKKNLTETLQKVGFKRIKVYQPVDFGLLPKLLKSRMNFSKMKDYKSWLRIAGYHYLSKLHVSNFAATSSMVVYAFK